ncbi:hypothetical protein RMATCC62417_07992 [Rhizopus microsporus]|nr:hypothetical protein RMATCC62417_07992 [Rhizopus microsporus]
MPPHNTAVVATTFGILFLKDHFSIEETLSNIPASDNDNSNNSYNSNTSNEFKLSLYKNSNIYRIILNNPVKSSIIQLNKWNRIDLKLVTELGLPVIINDQLELSIPITCKLLQGYATKSTKTCGYVESRDLAIECRPVHIDSWNTEGGDKGFGYSNYTGSFEYRVINNNNKGYDDGIFFIHIQAENQCLLQQSLPLCLGPFQLQDTSTQEDNFYWTDDISNNVNTHRILSLNDHRYLILKEMWDHGTSGKLWDSAVVIGQVITRLFKHNRAFLSGLRIMDLSAGIGSLGLLISQLCHVYDTPHPPTVVLTDIPEALPLIKHNLSLNSSSTDNIRVKPLRWGLAKDIKALCKQPFDYIFVSDVLYNTEDFYPLITTFRLLTGAKKARTRLYLGYKPRGLKQYEEVTFFSNSAVYFDITRLSLEDFVRDLLDGQGTMDDSMDQILSFTGVQLYRFVPKRNE